MKTYEGEADGEVYVAERGKRRHLAPRHDLRNHSPTGFAWGYGGSGPAQLALAILADVVGDTDALAWYQPFKWRAIATLDREKHFSLSENEVRDVLQVLKLEGAGQPV